MQADPGNPEAAETGDQSRRIPLTRMRGAIARAMSASAAVPQFTLESDASLRALRAIRAETGLHEAGVSVTDYLLAACAGALTTHPRLNASFDEDAILEHVPINVAVAVSLDDGLIAPALRDADRLDLRALAAERARLTAAATAGALTPADVLSATFTISNLGSYGVRRFRALVVPPQAAILAVGAATADDAVALSLSCDHRVIDGAPAAIFLGDVVSALESEIWLRSVSLGPNAGSATRTWLSARAG
jgi:pyruvate dehydrogenase E2 component (dihydrolipoamide acetyltransferase)